MAKLPKKQATEADKALLAKILGEAKPYVEKKRAEVSKPKESWESQTTKNKQEEITTGKADYVFIDTKRNPAEVTWTVIPQNIVWHVCRNTAEFIEYLLKHGLPKHISLDHDLTPPKASHPQTAADVIYALEAYCLEHKVLMPEWSCHSKLLGSQQKVEAALFASTSKIKKANHGRIKPNTSSK